jgi:transcriptional regulator with XRE-family HTH domain
VSGRAGTKVLCPTSPAVCLLERLQLLALRSTVRRVKDKAKETVTAAAGIRHLGDYIRDQRARSDISLRQLAKLAGVSNPYLSQIERGLRKPSAEILQQIAKGLRISAEALYIQAGFLEQRATGAVVDAILSDEALTERQKQVLLEVYQSFRKEEDALNGDVAVSVVTTSDAEDVVAVGAAEQDAPAPEPRKRARRTTPTTDAPHDPST